MSWQIYRGRMKHLSFKEILWNFCEIWEVSSGGRLDASRKNFEKSQKTFEKPLDKTEGLWYNIRAPWERHKKPHKNAWMMRAFEKTFKKLEKLSKNPLTNEKECGIIYKLSAGTGTSESIIENWTARAYVKTYKSTKQINLCKLAILKRNTTHTKSKTS